MNRKTIIYSLILLCARTLEYVVIREINKTVQTPISDVQDAYEIECKMKTYIPEYYLGRNGCCYSETRAVDYIHLKYEEREEERRLANAYNERMIRLSAGAMGERHSPAPSVRGRERTPAWYAGERDNVNEPTNSR